MKTVKYYQCGPYRFTAYMKTVGSGYEIGLTTKDKQIFVGNFIHRKEANDYWKYMGKNIKSFFKKYTYPFETQKTFYTHMMTSHLYRIYYSWLDSAFRKYSTSYQRDFNRDLRQYRTQRKYMRTSEQNDYRYSA